MDRKPAFANLAPRPKLPAGAAAPALPARQYSEAEWTRMHPHIRKLYLEDGRTLHDVMARMEREHSFKATKQMYKKRFAKWGFAKNRRRQRHAVLPLLALLPCIPGSRNDASSSSGDEERAEQHEREHQLGALAAAFSSTVTTLVAVPASPAPLPADLAAAVVLTSIRTWNGANFGAGAWMPHPDTMSLYVVHPDRPRREDSSAMYRTFALAADLFVRGQGTLAGKAVRKAFLMLEDVVHDDGPATLWTLIDMVYDLLAQGQRALLDMFLQHFAWLARRTLPAQHPLAQIFAQLQAVSRSAAEAAGGAEGAEGAEGQGLGGLARLLQQAWACNTDILEAHLGCEHLWLYEQLIWDTSALRSGRHPGQARPGEADRILATLWGLEERARTSRGASDTSVTLRIFMLLLEFSQMQLGDVRKSRVLALELLQRSTGAAGAADADAGPDGTEAREGQAGAVSPSLARVGAYARKMLARMDMQAAAWDAAQTHMRAAIRLREAVHGRDSPRVVREMWFLQAVLRNAGHTAEAARVGADAIERLSRYLADIPDFEP